MSTPENFDDIDDSKLDPLFGLVIDAAKPYGSISELELMSAIRTVELTHDVIEEIRSRLAEAGIDYVEHEIEDAEEDEAAARSPHLYRHQSFSAIEHGNSGDPVKLYMREITSVPLLTHAEEIHFAERVDKGLKAAHELAELVDEYGSHDSIPENIRLPFDALVAHGLDAKQNLIEANLRLVVSVAKRYRNRGVPFLDLIQEGNCGLMHAVEKFDYTRGFKFSTYATWWIRQAVLRSIADQSRSIRIPVHLFETVVRVARTQRELSQTLGHEPSLDELSARVGFTPERVEELMQLDQDILSIEQPLSSESNRSLEDSLVDRGEAPPDAATHALLSDAVTNILKDLPERDQRIVRLRFGLVDGEVHTLEEVGDAFGVTRERIRQIETKVLNRLRNPKYAHQLQGYLTEA